MLITEQMLLDAIETTQELIKSKEEELVINASAGQTTDYKDDLDEIDTMYRLRNKLRGMMKERFGVVL